MKKQKADVKNLIPGAPKRPGGLSPRATVEWDRLLLEMQDSGIVLVPAYRALLMVASVIILLAGLKAAASFFIPIVVAFFLAVLTYPIMRRYGDLRRLLRTSNALIGDIDTIIAATAFERNLTVVTAALKRFASETPIGPCE